MCGCTDLSQMALAPCQSTLALFFSTQHSGQCDLTRLGPSIMSVSHRVSDFPMEDTLFEKGIGSFPYRHSIPLTTKCSCTFPLLLVMLPQGLWTCPHPQGLSTHRPGHCTPASVWSHPRKPSLELQCTPLVIYLFSAGSFSTALFVLCYSSLCVFVASNTCPSWGCKRPLEEGHC